MSFSVTKQFADAFTFIKDLINNRELVWLMARRDFQNKYAGSFFGIFWAFLQPIAMMSILWFVFTYGLKATQDSLNVPFAAWFFSAMISWNYFQDALIASTSSLNEYSFLVKKVKFKVSILPLVKVFSAFLIHLIFIVLLCIILIGMGIKPSLYWLQSLYYMFCLTILVLGCSWFTSALNAFGRDIGQGVAIILQFGFWVTPIIWNYQSLSPSLHWIIKLNPMFYIIEGYRNSFLFEKAIWTTSIQETVYFWGCCLLIFFLGAYVFKSLKAHFADVL